MRWTWGDTFAAVCFVVAVWAAFSGRALVTVIAIVVGAVGARYLRSRRVSA